MSKDKELVTFLAHECDKAQDKDKGMDCLDENLLARLDAGLITGEERDHLILHIARCPDCRKRISSILAEADLQSLKLPKTKVLRPERRARPFIYAAAASVVLMVGASLYFSLGQQAGTDFGIDTRNLLIADAGLSQLGYDLKRRVTRAEVKPAVDEAKYRTMILKLSSHLEQPSPRGKVLALATRAALSARFLDDAVQYAERWVQIAPNDSAAFNALGLAQFQRNKFTEALAAFEKARSLSPKQPSFYLNAAMAADEVDRTDKVIQYLRQFIVVAPSHPKIEEAKRWLIEMEKTD